VYLGSDDGLYCWNGGVLQAVPLPQAETSVAPDWPKWPQPYWTDGELCRYESCSRIEIADPFPGTRAPAGRFYEIEKRDHDRAFWLIEEMPDGQRREYQFRPPFWYGPHVLFPDYEGNIWAAGTCHLYRFDGEQVSTLVATEHEHFFNDHIYSFTADPRGNVWIGTERGLALYRDGEFVPPPREISGTIFALTHDARHDQLIVSTPSGGLYVYSDDEWRGYEIPRHLSGVHHRLIRSVTVAEDGTLWLATNSGAMRCSVDMRQWVIYGDEFTEGVILGEDGRVFVNGQLPYVLVPRDAAGE